MSVEPGQRGRQEAFLRRVIRPRLANMTPEAAKAILALRLDDRDRGRMHELLLKVKDGSLTLEDEGELEAYQNVGHFLDLMRAKALGSLKKSGIDDPPVADE